MKTYEITYLTIQEESNDAKTISPILAHHQAKIISVHPWGGRRKLAYPIKKQDQAFFTTVVFDAETSAIAPIERDAQLSSDIMRDIVVEFVPGMFHRAPEREETPGRAERPAPAPTVTEEAVASSTSVVETEPASVEAVAEAEPKEAAPKRRRATKAVTTEDKAALDEKLDALLNEDLTK